MGCQVIMSARSFLMITTTYGYLRITMFVFLNKSNDEGKRNYQIASFFDGENLGIERFLQTPVNQG